MWGALMSTPATPAPAAPATHTAGMLAVFAGTLLLDCKGRIIATAPESSQLSPSGDAKECFDETRANAARLVKCWNDHDALVAENVRLRESLRALLALNQPEYERGIAERALGGKAVQS